MEEMLKRKFLELTQQEGIPPEIAIATLEAELDLPDELAETMGRLLCGLEQAENAGDDPASSPR